MSSGKFLRSISQSVSRPLRPRDLQLRSHLQLAIGAVQGPPARRRVDPVLWANSAGSTRDRAGSSLTLNRAFSDPHREFEVCCASAPRWELRGPLRSPPPPLPTTRDRGPPFSPLHVRIFERLVVHHRRHPAGRCGHQTATTTVPPVWLGFRLGRLWLAEGCRAAGRLAAHFFPRRQLEWLAGTGGPSPRINKSYIFYTKYITRYV
jgi:hypothetical protein